MGRASTFKAKYTSFNHRELARLFSPTQVNFSFFNQKIFGKWRNSLQNNVCLFQNGCERKTESFLKLTSGSFGST